MLSMWDLKLINIKAGKLSEGEKGESKRERKAWWLGEDNEERENELRRKLESEKGESESEKKKIRQWKKRIRKWTGENEKVKRGKWKWKGEKEERVQLLPPNPPATDQNKNKTHLQKREDKERHSLAGKILQSLWKQLTTVGVFLINHVPTGVEWGGPSDGKVPGPVCRWFAVTQIWSWHR